MMAVAVLAVAAAAQVVAAAAVADVVVVAEEIKAIRKFSFNAKHKKKPFH